MLKFPPIYGGPGDCVGWFWLWGGGALHNLCPWLQHCYSHHIANICACWRKHAVMSFTQAHPDSIWAHPSATVRIRPQFRPPSPYMNFQPVSWSHSFINVCINASEVLCSERKPICSQLSACCRYGSEWVMHVTFYRDCPINWSSDEVLAFSAYFLQAIMLDLFLKSVSWVTDSVAGRRGTVALMLSSLCGWVFPHQTRGFHMEAGKKLGVFFWLLASAMIFSQM